MRDSPGGRRGPPSGSGLGGVLITRCTVEPSLMFWAASDSASFRILPANMRHSWSGSAWNLVSTSSFSCKRGTRYIKARSSHRDSHTIKTHAAHVGVVLDLQDVFLLERLDGEAHAGPRDGGHAGRRGRRGGSARAPAARVRPRTRSALRHLVQSPAVRTLSPSPSAFRPSSADSSRPPRRP